MHPADGTAADAGAAIAAPIPASRWHAASRDRPSSRARAATAARSRAPPPSSLRRFSRMGSSGTPVDSRCRCSSAPLRSKSQRSVSGATRSSVAGAAKPLVSTQVWMPRRLASSRQAVRKAGCASGSPPEKVTPPPDCSKKGRSRSTTAKTSSTVVRWPTSSRAPETQASAHAPHRRHRSGSGRVGPSARPMGQTAWQAPQSMQRSPMMRISASRARLSGLWHQGQSSGQPFRNTVVRMPGPSWIEKRWISKLAPVGRAAGRRDASRSGSRRRARHSDRRHSRCRGPGQLVPTRHVACRPGTRGCHTRIVPRCLFAHRK